MAKARLIIDVRASLELNEAECGALDALVGYGTDEFLQCFYKHMGRSYLQRHEHGLRSLFEKVKAETRPALHLAEQARRAIYNHQRNG